MKRMFAIISCHKNAQRRDDCRSTWIKDINGVADYKFFLGKGEGTPKDDEVWLDVPDDYDGLPIKVREVCKWVLEQSPEYDYMLKVDDDTYIFPDRIIMGFEGHDYVGHHNLTNAIHCRRGFCSGFAYWLSRKAMKALSYGNPTIKWEDQWAGGCLLNSGIVAYDDKRYYIGSMIAKAMWNNFIPMAACFAEMGRDGDMKLMNDVVKGIRQIPSPLPATGKHIRLEPTLSRPVGTVVKAGSQHTGRPQRPLFDVRTGRRFFSPADAPRTRRK